MQKEHVRYVLTLFVLISTSAASVALGQSGPGLKQPILAATPPMGWNSWNHYKCAVSDAVIRAQADAMVTTGMKAVGYEYVNIDDCWQGQRDAKGYIHPNHKFPDMKALADYVHSKGLKLGIYSSPGPKSCDQYEGSYGHEQQDAEMFAACNIDYLKYDWCSARDVYQPPDYPRAFQKMHAASCAPAGPWFTVFMGAAPCGSGQHPLVRTSGGRLATSRTVMLAWWPSVSARMDLRHLPARPTGTIPTCLRSATAGCETTNTACT
jgi:hypothetical protein